MAQPSEIDTKLPGSASLTRAILVAWLLCGTLDIGIALTYYPLVAGARPLLILQGIASGLLGAAALEGGVLTAGLGLLCHYVIALIWTVCFFLVYPRIALLARSRALTAVVYGTFVSAVMTLVVLPLSNVRHRPFDVRSFVVGTVILWISIGLPLAVVAGRHYGGLKPRRR